MARSPALVPTQPEVDALASFIEVAEDLTHEPFLSEDERFSVSQSANGPSTYRLGDRTHFRSALISFRRLWMEREPTCYRKICGILSKYSASTAGIASLQRITIEDHRKGNAWLLDEVKTEDLIDLWINTVFAHGGLDPKRKSTRQFFDALVEQYGIGAVELGFRTSVWTSCLQLSSRP